MTKSVRFNITEEEIKEKSHVALNQEQLKKVLECIENDPCLWDAIDLSIESAVQVVKKGTSSECWLGTSRKYYETCESPNRRSAEKTSL